MEIKKNNLPLKKDLEGRGKGEKGEKRKKEGKRTKDKSLKTSWGNFIIKADKAYRKYREREELWRYGEAVITLLTIAFFVLFAIRPTVKAISSLLAEIRNKKEISQRMQLKINQIVEAQTNFSQVQEKSFLLDDAYPGNFSLAEGAAQLVGLAAENNLSFDAISFSQLNFLSDEKKRKEKEEIKGVKFNLSLRGEYFQAKKFIGEIRELRRLVRVVNYSLSLPEKKGESLVNINVSGELIYFSPQKGVKK